MSGRCARFGVAVKLTGGVVNAADGGAAALKLRAEVVNVACGGDVASKLNDDVVNVIGGAGAALKLSGAVVKVAGAGVNVGVVFRTAAGGEDVGRPAADISCARWLPKIRAHANNAIRARRTLRNRKLRRQLRGVVCQTAEVLLY